MLELYNEMWERRDVRVDNWFLMSSIWPITILTSLYLWFVKIYGPNYMKDRKPMDYKGLMMVYNLIQVALSMYMFINFLRGGWLGDYNWVCQPVDMDPNPEGQAMLMAFTLYVCFLSKILDFVDTIFFVIRKKDRQISFLHVFHHASMPIYAWFLVRWVPGGQESFGPLINSFIHFLMYSYYFLSGLGPHMQPYLWWKKYLTMMQMIQFNMVFFKCVLVISGVASCGYPWQMSLVTALFMVLFFGLFFQFYIQEYNNKKKLKSSSSNGEKKSA